MVVQQRLWHSKRTTENIVNVHNVYLKSCSYMQSFAVVSRCRHDESPNKLIVLPLLLFFLLVRVRQSTCADFHHGGDEKLQQGTACQNYFINKCCVHLQSSQCLIFNVRTCVVLAWLSRLVNALRALVWPSCVVNPFLRRRA